MLSSLSVVFCSSASQMAKMPSSCKLLSASDSFVSGGLTSLNLSDNQLCGLDSSGRGTYAAVGITAIADAMRVNGGMTSLNLSSNQLCGLNYFRRGTYTAEGVTAIADALRADGPGFVP
jgi:hypothetical protein